jgi:formylglycine-generating enzyme required for sulfatase activity
VLGANFAIQWFIEVFEMLAPNTLLRNRYLIIRELGRGGMGAVCEATDLKAGVAVAIKESLCNNVSLELRKAFEREALLLKGLKHQALPLVPDAFAEGARQFLVMEFIAGRDLVQQLTDRLNNGLGPFPVDQVLHWAEQLLGALEYLHEHAPPVIHRDIKPHNLKPTPRGQLILLDFGLAKGAVTQMSQPGHSVHGYTPGYAPLEQVRGTGTDARSDLYSVAAKLHHLLTGHVPPDELARASEIVMGMPDPLKSVTSYNPQVPAEIAVVIYRALSQNPDMRPMTARDMWQALCGKKQAPAPPTIIDPCGPTPPTVIDVLPPKAEPTTIVRLKPAQLPSLIEDLGNGVKLEMIYIPGGSFLMGSPDGVGYESERPQHRVALSPFYIGKYQITQAQWRAIIGDSMARDYPGWFQGGDLPFVHAYCREIVEEFCATLSQRTGRTYRLPSEAEWEYACRAGSSGKYCFGDDESLLEEYAWHHVRPGRGNLYGVTCAVGQKKPNAWGVYDMHDNVYEWCQDECPHVGYEGAPTDGSAWISDEWPESSVHRGGRSANRWLWWSDDDDRISALLGLRVVCAAGAK